MRVLLLVWILLAGCQPSSSGETNTAVVSGGVEDAEVKPGSQVLAEDGFRVLEGQRVGLIVNHTARVDTTHLIDLIHAAPNVELVVLFGPEHGLRGTADAGEKVSDGRDDHTGTPIYSLYGQTRKPTTTMLEGVDVLVFDIQDIGARFYTFISTMGLAMQAAADADIPFMVLDRPNPLGGDYVSGFVLEPEFTSFVGQYPIPVAHGMTVGELARMIQGEGFLSGLDSLQLEVVPVEGWERAMLWPETNQLWIPPSPNIPDFETALVYPGACFFEATVASEGRGTETPFRLLGASWAEGQTLADTLNARGLPGVRFEAARFTPRSIEGMASEPKLEGEVVQGIRYVLTDTQTFQPVETGVHVLHAFLHQAEAQGQPGFVARAAWLDKLAGTHRFAELLDQGASPNAIIAAWQEAVTRFKQQRQSYLLY